MEKLSLKKFEDYKLDKKQLSYIHAGDCDTGAGTNVEGEFEGVGVRHFFTYDSDYINSSGATFYNNLQYTHSQNGTGRFTSPALRQEF